MTTTASSQTEPINARVKSRAQELEDLAEKQAGKSAIQKVVDTHLGLLEQIRTKFPLDGVELISSDIRRKRGVIGDVSAEIEGLHRKIAVVIDEVAKGLEEGHYRSSAEAVSQMSLGYNERTRANSLLAADKKRLISCHSLNFAIEIFSELNKSLKERIARSEQAGDVKVERNLLLGNAILVYELTDFVIKYVENFKVEGVDEIAKLHAESKRRNEGIKVGLEDLRKMAQGKNVDPAIRDSTLNDVNMRTGAIDQVNAEWDKYIQQTQKLRDGIGLVACAIPTLQVIRANAKNQIQVLEAISVLQIVNNSLGALQQALKTLEGIELVSLTPERVRRLLGIDQAVS